jgi:apolipoprotein D and lipocalin family protein
MTTGSGLWIALALVAGVLLFSTSPEPITEPKAIQSVDLERYIGKWYSIAHIPTSFEAGCISGTTTNYSLQPDGKIEVLNECYDKRGALKVARGTAWVPNPEKSAKLKVSFVRAFGVPLFACDYWIIDLALDYSYAVVGHPTRKFGWILSRTPILPDDKLQQIKSALEAQGYDWTSFQLIDQSINVVGSGS